VAGTSGGSRRGHDLWPTTVSAVVDPNPRIRRITLTADQFVHFAPSGPDECFGLMVPTGDRLHLRWYTVATHRPERGEIDVCFVLHDHAGPGVAWARGARLGDRVGYRASGSAYRDPGPDSRQLLLGDETSLPALAAIMESLPDSRAVHAIVELPDPSYADLGADQDPELGIEWAYRGADAAGRQLLTAARAVGPAPGGRLDYVWVCGESGGVKAVRRHLVQAGMDRRRITFSGYWRGPQPRPFSAKPVRAPAPG